MAVAVIQPSHLNASQVLDPVACGGIGGGIALLVHLKLTLGESGMRQAVDQQWQDAVIVLAHRRQREFAQKGRQYDSPDG